MATILVIDDDTTARTVIVEMLTENGHQTVEARDGDEGLELFNEGKFDIVITDLIMPNVEGIETIIKLKKRHPAVNIIAVSGGGRISAVDHLSLAEKFDVNKTLTKPFRKDDLLKAVDEILGI
jgi:CheY-like chemotaxis protein